MNYRHSYHAGHFADVFKHMILISLLRELSHKESAFCYLDTHAGIADYDLESEKGQKTQEWRSGILKLWNNELTESLSPMILDYLQLVHKYNPTSALKYYPGSPRIARLCLRPQDRMILAELHSEDALTVKQLFARDRQVAVHHMDGYLALKAFLPPKEHRGLILIDPPFESKNEFSMIISHLKLAYKRFPSGIYAIWYPIKSRAQVQSFYTELKASGIANILSCELSVDKLDEDSKLTACGMVIINPPWQWPNQLKIPLQFLSQQLGTGSYKIKHLV